MYFLWKALTNDKISSRKTNVYDLIAGVESEQERIALTSVAFYLGLTGTRPNVSSQLVVPEAKTHRTGSGPNSFYRTDF